MRAQRIGLACLLLATHLAAYLVAGGPKTRQLAGTAEPSTNNPSASAPAKSAERAPQIEGHALLLDELVAMKLNRADYLELRRELFRDWIRRDLRGALDMIYGVETHGRFGTLSTELGAELEQAISDSGRQVWHWIASGRYGSNRRAIYQGWLESLAKKGQADLVLDLLAELPAVYASETVGTLCERATAEQLAKLRDVIGSTVAGPVDAIISMDPYVERKVVLARGHIAAALAGEEDPMYRQELAKEWVKHELGDLAGAEAVAAFLKLPEELQASALPALLEQKHHGGYPAVVEMLDEIGRQNLWEMIPEEERQGLISEALSHPFNRFRDAGEIYPVLAKIEDPAIRRLTLTAGGSLSQTNTRESECVANLDQIAAGEDRDAFIAGMVSQDIHDLAIYTQMVARVADEDLRKKLLQRLQAPAE